jgi:hypothetical protein
MRVTEANHTCIEGQLPKSRLSGNWPIRPGRFEARGPKSRSRAPQRASFRKSCLSGVVTLALKWHAVIDG